MSSYKHKKEKEKKKKKKEKKESILQARNPTRKAKA